MIQDIIDKEKIVAEDDAVFSINNAGGGRNVWVVVTPEGDWTCFKYFPATGRIVVTYGGAWVEAAD